MSAPLDTQEARRPNTNIAVLVIVGLIVGGALGGVLLFMQGTPRQQVAAPLLPVAAAAPTAPLGVTPAGFLAINTGMTYEQAAAILGSPDSSAFDQTGEARTVDWSDGGDRHITLIFMRNYLVGKNQVNVQPGPSTDRFAKVRACQADASACSEDCDTDWKQCIGPPGTPPSQRCDDAVDACRDACSKQILQCDQ
jgi:hypothetical protein